MRLAIYYHADGFDTSRPKLMGRHAAGEEFLKAYARHGSADQFYCYTRSRAQFQDFKRRIEAYAGERPARWIPRKQVGALSEAGCLFVPGPNIGEFAWQRRYAEQRGYSLCGVTHTTATHRIMDAIGELLVAPVQPWDAVICTSQVVKSTFERVLADWGEYLGQRLGGSARLGPRLPVIPLGVDCAAYAPSPETERARAEQRERLGIGEGDLAALFVGRLSFHAKANPTPMYLGLERAAKASGRRLHLILAGWFGNETTEKAFLDAARALCPSVRVICADGRKPEVRWRIWFAADLFTSLSDNLQETFGLTPVEGMAAGLPVVASDWNGYRDTVRDGVEGFLVPTHMPAAGLGRDLALGYFLGTDSYDAYVGKASQCTAVDVDRAAEAYTRLALDDELRRKMGEAGRERARQVFDWPVIIAAYERLWQELAELRRYGKETAPRRARTPAHPLRADPFRAFASYPTEVIGPTRTVALAPNFSIQDLRLGGGLRINAFADGLFASEADCERLLDHLAENGPTSLRDLLGLFPPAKRPAIQRTVGHIAKLGGLRFERPD